jgi:hypothetical protein
LSVASTNPPPTHRPFGTSATTAVSRLAIDVLALMGLSLPDPRLS